LHINDKDEVLDDKGRVVGKVIGGNKITIDTVAVLPDLVKQDEPKLCPAYQPDRPGSDRGLRYEDNRARQYENFVKRIINPEGPTPSGFAYYLPRSGGGPVSFDDCQWKTGFMFEIKGETYTHLLTVSHSDMKKNVEAQILKQSGDQIEASGGRPIVWVFAEKEAAQMVQKLFNDVGGGRQFITVVHIPWDRRNP
jgi:hypothetical protein